MDDLDTFNGEISEEKREKEEARLLSERTLNIPRAPFNEDGGHPLQYGFAFWFVRRSGARFQENYERNVKKIGQFRTVEGFWKHYNHLLRPTDLPNTSDYHLFREGIKPLWEDDANKLGGKWIIRLKKGLATKYWEDMLLATIGGQFQVGDEVCGVVCSIRFQEDILSVWNRNADNKQAKLKIYETVKTVLNLPPNTVMEYKAHDDSIKDHSSFRNTDVFRVKTEAM